MVWIGKLSTCSFFLFFLFSLCSCSSNPNSPEISNIHKIRYYGENCTEAHGEFCDIKETLKCINQTCQCSDPKKAIFDTSRGLCVGRAGQPCLMHPSEKNVSFGKRNPCVLYASCEDSQDKRSQDNSTCQCWSSFFSNEEGICIRKRGYLENCVKNEHCNNRKGYICNKDLGICTCDTKVSSYNMDTERCVGLPNFECVNAYQECTENHRCKLGMCRCKFKEVEAANGTLICDPVRHKYGKACGRFRGDCGDENATNLRCLDGKCRCRNPDYQIYDYDRRLCTSKVGGPCTLIEAKTDVFRNGTINSKFNALNFPLIQCIAYADCVPHNNNANSSTKLPLGQGQAGVCECGDSFIETKKGLYSLPFGADCDTSSKNKTDQCSDPLKCISNRCACQNEVDVYESGARKCAKSVNSICWKDGSCVKNAECRKRVKNLPGRCKCRAKFRSSPMGSCV